MKNLKLVEQLTDDALNNMISEFCHEHSIPLELVAGQIPVFGSSTVVIESTPSLMPDPFWELMQQTHSKVLQALAMPSEFIASGTTGTNSVLPFKSKEEWQRAFAKAQIYDPNAFIHGEWPTNNKDMEPKE